MLTRISSGRSTSCLTVDGPDNSEVSKNDPDRQAGRIVDPVPDISCLLVFATLSSSIALFGNCYVRSLFNQPEVRYMRTQANLREEIVANGLRWGRIQ